MNKAKSDGYRKKTATTKTVKASRGYTYFQLRLKELKNRPVFNCLYLHQQPTQSSLSLLILFPMHNYINNEFINIYKICEIKMADNHAASIINLVICFLSNC